MSALPVFEGDLKEAAGVCGGCGQVMEKVRECGLKLSRAE
jgi:hypothetical protein